MRTLGVSYAARSPNTMDRIILFALKLAVMPKPSGVDKKGKREKLTASFGQRHSVWSPRLSTVQHIMYVCMVITYSKGKDQSGKVANPARGQLNRENAFFPVPLRA